MSPIQKQVARHFFARAFALILVPAIVYMLFFWIHFRVLSHSGTGDDFMSPQFQESLIGSPLTVDSEGAQTFIHRCWQAELRSLSQRSAISIPLRSNTVRRKPSYIHTLSGTR